MANVQKAIWNHDRDLHPHDGDRQPERCRAATHIYNMPERGRSPDRQREVGVRERRQGLVDGAGVNHKRVYSTQNTEDTKGMNFLCVLCVLCVEYKGSHASGCENMGAMMLRRFAIAAAAVLTGAAALAQSPAQQQLERGIALWDQRLANSAIAALEIAARIGSAADAAAAHEALGRIYMFKGWQQESVFPGWHDEPGVALESAGRAEGRRRRRSGPRLGAGSAAHRRRIRRGRVGRSGAAAPGDQGARREAAGVPGEGVRPDRGRRASSPRSRRERRPRPIRRRTSPAPRF